MPTAATLDACRALKIESPAEQGTQADLVPTEVTTTQDALAAAGLYVEGPSVTAPDKAVLLDRTSAGMRFTDSFAQQQLSNIVGAAYSGYQPHSGLPDASHLDGFGPDAGFASGAYLSTSMNGPLVTNMTWWTSASMTQKVYQVAISYAGPQPTQIVTTTYTPAGATLRIFTDTLIYSGPLLTGQTRTWV